MNKMQCVVCGNNHFAAGRVLWDELVNEWQISQAERDYIDRQQGTKCTACDCNIRSQALARAVLSHWHYSGFFSDFIKIASDLSVLELNEAAQLTRFLAEAPNRVLGEYPKVDMCALPYASESFDLVIHSDTLEHVPNPILALRECRRVLKQGGLLAFTVPVIVGRLTRTRDGLPPSYHGAPGDNANDYVVVSEYGADMWQQLIDAGFDEVKISTFDYPAGIAVSASKGLHKIKRERTFLQKIFGK